MTKRLTRQANLRPEFLVNIVVNFNQVQKRPVLNVNVYKSNRSYVNFVVTSLKTKSLFYSIGPLKKKLLKY